MRGSSPLVLTQFGISSFPLIWSSENSPARSPKNCPYAALSATSSRTTSSREPVVLSADVAAARAEMTTLNDSRMVI